jgi:hypothetical protein
VDLRVEATLASASAGAVAVDDDVMPFVHDVEYAAGSAWLPAAAGNGGWLTPCHAAGCRLRYRVALGAAAASIRDVETAWAAGGLVVAPPSAWLLRPAGAGDGVDDAARFRFHVSTDGGGFATGVHPAAGGAPDTYEAPANAIDSVSFAVFGAFHGARVAAGGARLDVAIAPQGLSVADADAARWVETAAGALGAYYGRFPVGRTLVVVAPGGGPVTRGETLGDGGPAIVVRAASAFTGASIADDWVLTHELVHVTLPTLGRAHAWLEEGIATYVEPIARARAGLVPPVRFWRDLVEGLPQGLPGAGDEGLERTHTWGRTYWGGALFCFVADIRIRERTGGARSFDDALRGVIAAGDDVESRWDVARFVDTGDRATGTTVLAELYRELALAPGRTDLAALWTRLGVRVAGGPGAPSLVGFDDSAPLAAARHAITAGR